VILDTTAITAWADKWPTATAIILSAPRRVLPIVALGEYEYGIRSSQKRSYYEHWIENTLFPLCEVLPITLKTSRIYSPLYHALSAKDVLQNLERKAAAAEQEGMLGDNP